MTNGNGSENYWTRAAEDFLEESLSAARRLARVPLVFRKMQELSKGVTPSEVVFEEDRVQLLRYKSDQVRHRTPLIFVFALVNRSYILDLKPGKSVVEHFVKRGFDTYLIDWGIPSDADRHLTLDDHINGYLLDIVDHVRRRSGARQVSLMGYCMGGTMSTMFTALHPDRVKNLMLMAAGIDFATREGLLNLWADPGVYDVDRFISAFGNCPPEFLQTSFLMLKPIQNLIEKPLNFLERMNDETFIEEYLAMEQWLNDNIPVPGEVYREFVKYLYQQNRLVKNEMPVGHDLVNLKNITCPVLNLMATKDDLVPCAQSRPFTDLVGSADRKTLEFQAGHIGLAVGSRAHKELWPQVCDWLAARSDEDQGKQTPRRTRRRK